MAYGLRAETQITHIFRVQDIRLNILLAMSLAGLINRKALFVMLWKL